ncbi:DUF2511 domain-containing protein [Serratia quinivorans]|uniref:DUF2511 domain-containing protein n=1 Tax=Serratia quinivorans TaxID=137545 RepID=UPI00217BB5FF|nr:DUF2511 domain-containing protein [Serratia quinivorans]CAI1018028.1 Protein of uncharacterised function (DUF2511) [Serratia quinivorans]
MSLKNCKECKKEVSTTAKTCPHCGAKNPGQGKVAETILGLFGFAIIGIVLYFIFGSGDSTSDKNEATHGKDHTDVVYQKDFGDEWAFTFDRGVLICDRLATYIENPKTNTLYPLNGIGIQRMQSNQISAEPLDSVWRDDPQPYGVKVDISPFSELAQKLCD